MDIQNVYGAIPDNLPQELFTDILKTNSFRVERIVSHGHASPEGSWYNQETDEWVIVLEGAARVLFEGDADAVELRPGSYVNIPAHKLHRVEWTAADQRTVWLAIHYEGERKNATA